MYDKDTELSYLNARYYDGSIGRFISQDPVFWEVGQSEDGKKTLINPQAQNSYAYGNNNPVSLSDPKGRVADTAIDLGFIVYDTYKLIQASLTGGNVKQELQTLGLDVAGALIPGVTGLGFAGRVNKVDKIVNTSKTIETLPDSAQVCRGGLCKAENFINGKGVTLESGKLKGVSVNAGDVSVSELLKNIPNNLYGSTTVGEIRKLGGDVIRDTKNSFHSTLQGITPSQAEKLFTPTKVNNYKKIK